LGRPAIDGKPQQTAALLGTSADQCGPSSHRFSRRVRLKLGAAWTTRQHASYFSKLPARTGSVTRDERADGVNSAIMASHRRPQPLANRLGRR
jgi:hypothetical protein